MLEASGRPGGHVKTIHDPLPDGLYADVGAEHFTRPGYDQYWKYVEKFGLPFVAYPRGSTCSGGSTVPGTPRRSSRTRRSSASFGFNPKEVEFIVPPRLDGAAAPVFRALPRRDRRRVPAVRHGLDHLDEMTAAELLREGWRRRTRPSASTGSAVATAHRPRATANYRPCSGSGRRRSSNAEVFRSSSAKSLDSKEETSS